MPSVGILGAGTMGAGIAQTAASCGWTVELMDVNEEVARKAIAGIVKRLDRLVEKGRTTAEKRDAGVERLLAATGPNCFEGCDLIIEAVIEDIDLKVAAWDPVVRASRPDAILASNTSSLSISEMGRRIGEPRRFVGMHFFNPVPLMPLVEVIAGDGSDPAIVARALEIPAEWGKTVVKAADTPGFIVNRIARGFYLEPLRMLGEGIAGVDELDRILKTLGGFRMGPFELMDLIGIDVNWEVSNSVWRQLGEPARLTPHPIQQRLVEQKLLGRKTKRGFYSYASDPPLPALPVERRSFELGEDVYKAVRLFNDHATEQSGSITEQYVFARTLAAIINEAALALDASVASQTDIDTAMKRGTNYPQGPLEWAEQIGRHSCRFMLDVLNEHAEDERFQTAEWLRL